MANLCEITSIDNPSVTGSLTADQFGPHCPTTLSEQSLQAIKTLCKVPSEVEFALPTSGESPESVRPGYICMYEVYFTGCGIFFPLPEVLVLFLHTLGLAFSQMTPNMLRNILGIVTVAAEAGYSLSPSDLLELCSVRSARKGPGYYTIYPNTDRNLITGLPEKDEHWKKSWFLVKKNVALANGLTDLLQDKWASSFVAKTRPAPCQSFLEFYHIVTEGNTTWNSFTLDRIHKAGESLRGGKLHALEPAPEAVSTLHMSLREKKRFEATEKRLRKQIDEVGKCHREKTRASNDKTPGKTSLISDISSCLATSSPLVPPVADDVEVELSIGSLKRKRQTKNTDLSSRHKLKLGTDDQGSGFSALRPLPPLDVSNPIDSVPESSTTPWSPSLIRCDEWMKMAEAFRLLSNRSDMTLPTFEKWCPSLREKFINYARHTTQAAKDINDIVCYCQQILRDQSSSLEAEAIKKVASDYEKTIHGLKEASGKDAETMDRLRKERDEARKNLDIERGKSEEVAKGWEDKTSVLRKERDEARKNLDIERGKSEELAKDWEEKISILRKERDEARNNLDIERGKSEAMAKGSEDKISALRQELNALNESSQKYHALLKQGEHDIKEVKGKSRMLLHQLSKHLECLEARSILRTDINELKSNLILLDTINDDDFNLENEKTDIKNSLAKFEPQLDALVVAPLDLEQFAAYFADSPPPHELNLDLPTERSDVSAADVSVVPLLSSDKVIFDRFGSNIILIIGDQLARL